VAKFDGVGVRDRDIVGDSDRFGETEADGRSDSVKKLCEDDSEYAIWFLNTPVTFISNSLSTRM
jgi:hypothetical protein